MIIKIDKVMGWVYGITALLFNFLFYALIATVTFPKALEKYENPMLFAMAVVVVIFLIAVFLSKLLGSARRITITADNIINWAACLLTASAVLGLVILRINLSFKIGDWMNIVGFSFLGIAVVSAVIAWTFLKLQENKLLIKYGWRR